MLLISVWLNDYWEIMLYSLVVWLQSYENLPTVESIEPALDICKTMKSTMCAVSANELWPKMRITYNVYGPMESFH